MPIKVEYRGAFVWVETLDDAATLLSKLSGTAVPGTSHEDATPRASGGEGRWTVSRFKDFTNRLSAPQLKMLQELVRSAHGRTAKDLAPTLGFNSSKSFGPLLAAMSKHAKKAGIAMQDILVSDRIDVGNERMLEFRAAPSFARVAVEAGWRNTE